MTEAENAPVENPYQATLIEDPDPPPTQAESPQLTQGSIVWIAAKWTFICCLSAAPSFIWGCQIGSMELSLMLAMLLGILVFVIGYTIFECTAFAQRLLLQPGVRLTAKIGYGTRMGISIVFPVGMFMDAMVGIASTAITDSLLPFGMGAIDGGQGTFLAFFITTILQGILLNILLFCYMAVVYVIIFFVRSSRKHI